MRAARIVTGDLSWLAQIERPIADDSLDGAGSGSWQFVDEVWVNLQDMLPSRGERMAEGVNVTARPARIRMRWRTDITSDMRILIGRRLLDEEGNSVWHTDRVTQIVSAPAELGRRNGLELLVEDYQPAGNAA